MKKTLFFFRTLCISIFCIVSFKSSTHVIPTTHLNNPLIIDLTGIYPNHEAACNSLMNTTTIYWIVSNLNNAKNLRVQVSQKQSGTHWVVLGEWTDVMYSNNKFEFPTDDEGRFCLLTGVGHEDKNEIAGTLVATSNPFFMLETEVFVNINEHGSQVDLYNDIQYFSFEMRDEIRKGDRYEIWVYKNYELYQLFNVTWMNWKNSFLFVDSFLSYFNDVFYFDVLYKGENNILFDEKNSSRVKINLQLGFGMFVPQRDCNNADEVFLNGIFIPASNVESQNFEYFEFEVKKKSVIIYWSFKNVLSHNFGHVNVSIIEKRKVKKKKDSLHDYEYFEIFKQYYPYDVGVIMGKFFIENAGNTLLFRVTNMKDIDIKIEGIVIMKRSFNKFHFEIPFDDKKKEDEKGVDLVLVEDAYAVKWFLNCTSKVEFGIWKFEKNISVPVYWNKNTMPNETSYFLFSEEEEEENEACLVTIRNAKDNCSNIFLGKVVVYVFPQRDPTIDIYDLIIVGAIFSAVLTFILVTVCIFLWVFFYLELKERKRRNTFKKSSYTELPEFYSLSKDSERIKLLPSENTLT